MLSYEVGMSYHIGVLLSASRYKLLQAVLRDVGGKCVTDTTQYDYLVIDVPDDKLVQFRQDTCRYFEYHGKADRKCIRFLNKAHSEVRPRVRVGSMVQVNSGRFGGHVGYVDQIRGVLVLVTIGGLCVTAGIEDLDVVE